MDAGELKGCGGFSNEVIHRPSIAVTKDRQHFLLLPNINYFLIFHLFFFSDTIFLTIECFYT